MISFLDFARKILVRISTNHYCTLNAIDTVIEILTHYISNYERHKPRNYFFFDFIFSFFLINCMK